MARPASYAGTKISTSASCNISAYTAGDDCEVYSYDANGNLLSKRTRAGQTIAFTYDDLNRVTQKTRPDTVNNVAYGYDLLGRVTSLYQDSLAVQRHPMAYTYDKVGRVTQLVEDGWTSDYGYDQAGNRNLFRYPHQGLLGSTTNDGFYLTYDYDALNRLTNIRENGAASGIGVLASYAYDELSRSTVVALGNGTNRTVTYKPDSSVGTVGLDLDAAGAANDNLYTLAYNQIPQIASVTTTKAAFDWNGYSNVNRAYTPNGLNQYTQSGTKTLGYDDNGNLISDQTWAFAYDAENELVTANATGAALAYRYDGLGRMDRRQLNSNAAVDYLYDGQSLIAEHDAGANPQGKRYVHGAGVDAPLVEYTRQGDGSYARSWYAADYKGSIVATTNDAGITLAIYSYGDFGEPNTLGGPTFRYTGQRLDPDSGLYYYKARWYSANLGRFLQIDPVGTEDDINLYAYVGNDPVNMIDPTGMTAAEWVDGTIVITGQRLNYSTDTSVLDAKYGSGANVSQAGLGDLLVGDHDYISGPNLICPSSWGCSAALVGSTYSQVNNSVPGNSSAQTVRSGNYYSVRVAGVYIGDVRSYAGSGGLTVSNLTTKTHLLYDGFINRNAFQDSNGNWYSTTHGAGTNYYGGVFNAIGNQVFGPILFDSMDASIKKQLYTATHSGGGGPW